ncbi:putative metallophosphoesterase YhaO [Symmachiella dynata]|uniref:Putative metallophosphoesterase YhaO n=1 Tax=Symmachiella dynata TaxID=2527995 RepID=A0A517ZPW5_9PLAN|nr:DNA repair exonuclease [Symmachiella dynata]QDU44536.1 putative metallophosphoesterase YhaO [Symmachiella dynata]
MKFIHAADIHLDSPLCGLSRYDGAPVDELRGATRRALQNLVEISIDEDADFVLIAGDVYDGDWKDHNTGLFFVSQMARLNDANIPVVLINGNHDAANKMTRELRLPVNVTRLSHRKAETAKSPRLEELGVAIHGRSFANAAEHDNFASDYPEKKPGMFNIGLLHTSLTGAEGHEPYAPCTLDDLRRKGYDYWALGHVHTRAILCDDPFVVFPGNIQGRHIREPGPKGCYVVTTESSGGCQLDFYGLDVARWEQVLVNVRDTQSKEEVLDRCNDALVELADGNEGKPLAVRVTLSGATPAHQALLSDQVDATNQIRSIAMSATGNRAWIEKVEFRTSPPASLSDVSETDGPLAELVQYIEELRGNPSSLQALSTALSELRKKLPDDVLRGPDAILLDKTDFLTGVMNDVQAILVQRLSEEPKE